MNIIRIFVVSAALVLACSITLAGCGRRPGGDGVHASDAHAAASDANPTPPPPPTPTPPPPAPIEPAPVKPRQTGRSLQQAVGMTVDSPAPVVPRVRSSGDGPRQTLPDGSYTFHGRASGRATTTWHCGSDERRRDDPLYLFTRGPSAGTNAIRGSYRQHHSGWKRLVAPDHHFADGPVHDGSFGADGLTGKVRSARRREDTHECAGRIRFHDEPTERHGEHPRNRHLEREGIDRECNDTRRRSRHRPWFSGCWSGR